MLFLLGVAFDVYDRFEPLYTRLESGDELIGLLILALGGVATIAVRRAHSVREQTQRREIADERLRALIAESPVVSYSWDPGERRYLFISPQIEALFGVSADAHTDEWAAQIHPEDLERVRAISAQADDTRTTYLAEYRIIRPDGSIRWIHDESHYHHPGPDGRPALAQGVMFDITERIEAEARAADAEGRYRTLVERVPAIAYAWDTAFAPGTAPADYISPQIERLLGVTPQDWLDDPAAWADRVHPHDIERVTAAWDAATAAGAPFTQEYRLRTSDGAWLWVRDDANPVGPGVREAPVYQGVIIDITEQHAAEEEVRAAEQRWRLLLEHLPIVAYQVSFDPEGATFDRWVAGGIYQLVGVTALEWLADADIWDNLIHEDDRAAVLDGWEALKRDQAPFDRQYRLRRHDGGIVWVHDRAVITERDGARVVEGALADITARHDAEAALGIAEDRFRTLVEQLPAITFIEEIDTGTNLYVSPQIEAVYGYTAEEWMADSTLWEQRLHPEDRDRVMASNDAETGDEWSIDYRSLRKDGSVVWIHNDARLIRDHEGTPLYWQGVAYDITERMQAEERLRAAEERYRTLVEQLPVAIYTDAVDDLSTALYISPQYEQLTGYTPEQRLLDPDLWVKMLHPEDRDRVLARSVETNETGEPFDIEYRIVAADGHVVWVHDHAMQVHESNGQARWHGVLQDITENRRSAEAIARRDAILEATSFAAERFLRAPSWQEHLPEVLTRLGLAGEATRCAVFRNHSLPSGELGRVDRRCLAERGAPDRGRPHRERLRVGLRGLRPVGDRDVCGAPDPRDRQHLPAGGARGPRRGEAVDPIPRGHPDLRRRCVVGLYQLRSRERGPTLVGSRHGGAQLDREHDRRRDRARARRRPPRRGPGAVPHPDRTVARRHLHRGARDRRRELLEPTDRGAARLHERRVGIPCAMGRGDPPRGPRAGRGARREAGRHRRALSRRIPDADEERCGRVGAR